MVKNEGARVCFEFNKRDMSAAELIAELSGQVKIRDLSLEEPDIEDIIKTIYHSGEIGKCRPAGRMGKNSDAGGIPARADPA